MKWITWSNGQYAIRVSFIKNGKVNAKESSCGDFRPLVLSGEIANLSGPNDLYLEKA